jgi:hypothetical protein
MFADLATPRYRLIADLIASAPHVQELADDLDALFREGMLTVSRDSADVERFSVVPEVHG